VSIDWRPTGLAILLVALSWAPMAQPAPEREGIGGELGGAYLAPASPGDQATKALFAVTGVVIAARTIGLNTDTGTWPPAVEGTLTDDELHELFGLVRPVSEVIVRVDRVEGTSGGLAVGDQISLYVLGGRFGFELEPEDAAAIGLKVPVGDEEVDDPQFALPEEPITLYKEFRAPSVLVDQRVFAFVRPAQIPTVPSGLAKSVWVASDDLGSGIYRLSEGLATNARSGESFPEGTLWALFASAQG